MVPLADDLQHHRLDIRKHDLLDRPAKAHKPRVFKRPILPDLRHGRGAGAAGSGQAQKSRGAFLRGRGFNMQPRVSDLLADGKAVPREMVGLLKTEIQHWRQSLPHWGGRLRRVLGGSDPGFASRDQEPYRPADGHGAERHLRDFVRRDCERSHRDREGASRDARGLRRVRGAFAAEAQGAF